MTSTASAASATYTAARTSSGAKTHRLYGADMIACAADRPSTRRSRVTRTFEIEVGSYPEVPCSKCFPSAPTTTIAPARKPAPVAAPVAPKPAEARITNAEAWDMIEAAGFADKVGGRTRFLGVDDALAGETIPLALVLSVIGA